MATQKAAIEQINKPNQAAQNFQKIMRNFPGVKVVEDKKLEQAMRDIARNFPTKGKSLEELQKLRTDTPGKLAQDLKLFRQSFIESGVFISKELEKLRTPTLIELRSRLYRLQDRKNIFLPRVFWEKKNETISVKVDRLFDKVTKWIPIWNSQAALPKENTEALRGKESNKKLPGELNESTYCFKKDGEHWNLHFDEENGIYRGKGFAVIAELLENQGKSISVSHLVNPFIATPDHVKAASYCKSQKITESDKFTTPYEKRIRREIGVLKDEIENAKETNNDQTLEQREREMEQYLEVLKKDRCFAQKENEKARSSVKNNMNRAIKRLEKEMPKLGIHLKTFIKPNKYAFIYQLELKINWIFS